MGLLRWLNEKESRLPWSIVGTLLAVFSLLLGALALRDKQPELQISIVGDANVLDINARVAELEVRFQGQDLQALEQSLRVVSVQVANVGPVPIVQGSFDDQSNWGLLVPGARLVEARVVRSNDPYLSDRLDPVISADSVLFGKPIIERGAFAVVELVLLQRRNEPTVVLPFGKIAGIRQLEIAAVSPATQEPSLWSAAASGGIAIQLIRLLVYSVGSLVLVLVGVFIIATVSSAHDRRNMAKRRSQVQSFVAAPGPHPGIRAYLADLYVREGMQAMAHVGALLSDQGLLSREVQAASSIARQGGIDPERDFLERASLGPITSLTRELLEKGIVVYRRPQRPEVADGLAEAFRELLSIIAPREAPDA